MKNCKYVFPFLVYEFQTNLCANKLCFVSCGRVLHNEYMKQGECVLHNIELVVRNKMVHYWPLSLFVCYFCLHGVK